MDQPPKRDDPALLISSDEETEFTRARTTQNVGSSQRPNPPISKRVEAVEADDTSLIIIDPPAPRTPEVRRHHAAPPRFRSQSGSPATDQPWKRFKSKSNSSQSDFDEPKPTDVEKAESMPAQEITNAPCPGAMIESLRTEHDINAPLRLEPAMVRRLDWTPPSHKPTAMLKPGSPALEGLQSPGGPRGDARNFEQLLEIYKCADNLQQNATATTDEDATILRKRKLVELVMTSAAPAEASADPEIATSAYRAPEPPESVPLVADEDATYKEPDATTAKGGNKAKARKRTSKASAAKKKKPARPPPPVLLPPTEALQEVARQDFVFGTDGVEPRERKRLWAAGARDIDGDLFDVELTRIMERSSPPLPALSEDDPFGYTGVDKKITLPTVSINGADTSLHREPLIGSVAGSPSKRIEATNFIIADDSIQFGSDISTGSPVARRSKPAAESPPPKPQGRNSEIKQAESQASKPSFELYTDARLSKEIASYGFKAVKSRQAKIALLEQCWLAAAAADASQSEIRTPRGRPRKNSGSSPEAQEPPPSAQPPVSPSKPRGRPKKAATAASTAGKRTAAGSSRAKKTSSKTAAEASTARKRKAPAAKVIVEIPDSASESDGSLSPNPSPSPECASSPLPVDLSISVMDDTDPSLSLHPTEDRPLSHEYITKAITSAPRTTDPANPSWHEKMLLYDPIVLEDLTTWLNCGQLTRVGFDGEVSTMEVKQWSSTSQFRSFQPPMNLASCATITRSLPRRVSSLAPSAECVHLANPRAVLMASKPPTWTRLYSSPASAQKAKEKDSGATKKPVPEPRPSSSIVLLSPSNEVLLLHRVKTSTSFALAHVFPGGNLDAFHDGDIPAPGSKERHVDGPAYRLGAIRECFEETGILLATKDGRLVDLPQQERDEARKRIHGSHIKFADWLKSIGAVADLDGLIPFTRWVTPIGVPKRFTTQMYLYLIPISRTGVPSEMLVPTPDGGVEHTEALFAPPQTFLSRVAANEIILFPPQYYILSLLTKFLKGPTASVEEGPVYYTKQRRELLKFVKAVPTADTEKGREHPTASIPWADKVMSPHNLFIRKSDKRVVLGLDKPGPELKDSGRGGDWERVVLVSFGKAGPSRVEVRLREDVLREEREAAAEGSKL
ncbi:hypothetical protein MKX07_004772 [Trichoderma sp. CBMAI-0711]|nr:hypothetical protein MKX07_004772 [Trichoderma sp. CBMAI-0711]